MSGPNWNIVDGVEYDIPYGEWAVRCICCGYVVATAQRSVVLCGRCFDGPKPPRDGWDSKVITGGLRVWNRRHWWTKWTGPYFRLAYAEFPEVEHGRDPRWREFCRDLFIKRRYMPDGPCHHVVAVTRAAQPLSEPALPEAERAGKDGGW